MKITYPEQTKSTKMLSNVPEGTIFIHPEYNPYYLKLKRNKAICKFDTAYQEHVVALHLGTFMICVLPDTSSFIEYDAELNIK